MTISEQLREAVLYAPYPYADMSYTAFMECVGYREFPQHMNNLSNTDLRTYMLLVAEALE